MTHFVEALMLREVFGDDALRWRMNGYARLFNSASSEVRSTPICGHSKTEFADPLARGKGPWVLWTVAQTIGLEHTLEIMRKFTQKYLRSRATPRDFIEVAVEHCERTGLQQVGPLLEEWLYGSEIRELLGGL